MGFSLRVPGMNDLDAVVDMINFTSIHDRGTPRTDVEEKRAEWNSSLISREKDIRIAVNEQGDICGYVEAWILDPFVEANVWGCVHPKYRGTGIGSSLIKWGLERAGRTIGAAPEGARVFMRLWTPENVEEAGRLFRNNGFRLVRRFVRMKISWGEDGPPEQPVWPEGVAIRTYKGTGDNPALYAATDDAFKDHWMYVPEGFDKWQEWLAVNPRFDPELYVVAVEDDAGCEKIAGASLCFPVLDEDPDSGYIDTIFTSRKWRRKGLASALLRNAFQDLHRRGIRKASLGVDCDSLTGAVDLYRKAGMEPVRITDLYERELRPGWNYSARYRK